MGYASAMKVSVFLGIALVLCGCSSNSGSTGPAPQPGSASSTPDKPGAAGAVASTPSGSAASVEGDWRVDLATVKMEADGKPVEGAQLDEYKKNLGQLRISMTGGKFKAVIPDGTETGSYKIEGSKIDIHPDQQESIIPELTIIGASKIHEHESLPGNHDLNFDLVRA